MNIKTKFLTLPIIICFYLTMMSLGVCYLTVNSSKAELILPILLLLFVTYFWLTEFRTRAHSIAIHEEHIRVKAYFGLGKTKVYELKDLDGFITTFQPGKLGHAEYIFILKQGKRISSISEFHHKNYRSIKSELQQKIKYLGETEYEFKNEFKEMFK